MTQAFNLSQLGNNINSSGQVSLSAGVTGTLPNANLPTVDISHGGTNNSALAVTAGGVVYTDGTKLVNVGAGTANQVLTSNGSSAPTWATAGGGLGGMQVFTASGTFTIPSGVTKVKVTIVGGGGGGSSANTCGLVTGGGGGGCAIVFLSALTSGNTITVTRGGGGAAAAAGNNSNGTTGTSSSISSGTQTITTVTATGGTGGQYNGYNASGGSATNGTINFTGGYGICSYNAAVYGTGGSSFLGGSGNYGCGGNAGGTAQAGFNGVIVFEW